LFRRCEQVLIAHQQKSISSLAHSHPAQNVVFPRTHSLGIVNRLAHYKISDKLLQRKIIRQMPCLDAVMVEGGRDVPRVANQVNYAGISRIETFVALDHPGQLAKLVVRDGDDRGHETIKVGKGDGLLMYQVSQQKACPRTS